MLVEIAQHSRGQRLLTKNSKCQGLGWQPRNTAHWPRSWVSRGTGTWAAMMQPLCLSVFGKSSSHQQGQRVASTSKAHGRQGLEERTVTKGRAGGCQQQLQRGWVSEQPCYRAHLFTAGTSPQPQLGSLSGPLQSGMVI